MVKFEYLDKRIQRTKLDFYDALFEILKEKKYNQITVKDIIKLAGYSRGAFYNHYNKKDDLLNEMVEFLLNEASKAQRHSYIDETSIHIQSLENEPIYILNHFKRYGAYYKVLLGENITIDFRDKITKKFIEIYIDDFDMQDIVLENKPDKKLMNTFYAYGFIGLILDWVMNDFPIDVEKFSSQLVQIFKYSVGTIQIKKIN